MAELKTQKNDASVEQYLAAIEDEQQRADSRAVAALMGEITGEPPAMWGDSIIGLGSYHYRYDSGRSGDWPLLGLAARKRNLSLYIMSGFENHSELLARLGKHKLGKGCLYIDKLADVDMDVLRQLLRDSVEHMRATHGDAGEA